MALVAGRECGGCTVCCTVAPLLTAQVRKLPNTQCPHCTGQGCAIYSSRPADCRESYCGWRFYAELDDRWRPDVSGVLILTEHEAPAPLEGRVGIKFVLVDTDEPIRSERLISYICALVSRNVPVSLSVLGRPGHWPAKAFLNAIVEAVLGRRDPAAVTHALEDIARNLRAGSFEKASF